jgi:hypothetical protein
MTTKGFPMKSLWKVLLAVVGLLLSGGIVATQEPAPFEYQRTYDIVYVKAPRDLMVAEPFPEATRPYVMTAGADLVLLHPNGTETPLVECDICSVTDPMVSFDGKSVYYALMHDARPEARGLRGIPRLGSDIYRIDLATRAITRLTHQEFTPNTGAGTWTTTPVGSAEFDRTQYGVLNLGPTEIAGGKIMWTSARNAMIPTKLLTLPSLQLFTADRDGQNVEAIAPMTLGSTLHPTPLRDGRVMFSTYETQGARDNRLWGLWAIWPDGRLWEPLMSAMHNPQALHFQTQTTNGNILVADYYNLNTAGFGIFFEFPLQSPSDPTGPAFHSAMLADNPQLAITAITGQRTFMKMPFSPRGVFTRTPFTLGTDHLAPFGADGIRVGKVSQPSGAPENHVLTAYTIGPANNKDGVSHQPTYDSGIYLIPSGVTIDQRTQLVLIKNDPAFNEMWPRAVVPYREIHGVDEPMLLPWLENDGTVHPALPAGTAYSLVGTSSFYKRESAPGVGGGGNYGNMDPFNSSLNDAFSNWLWQGGDAGRFDNSEIHAVRIVILEGSSDRQQGPNAGQHFTNRSNERERILGEIPLRKYDSSGLEILDPEGNPDTSFLARIPADTPFKFHIIDKDGQVLVNGQTWHQGRPGEMRVNCGGCHAHSQQPLAFSQTAAGKPGFTPVDLTSSVQLLAPSHPSNPNAVRVIPGGAQNVEFYKDIVPILQKACVSCHTKNNPTPPGNLVLDDMTMSTGFPSYPNAYIRLARDTSAQFGYKSMLSGGIWRTCNQSRYIRCFQSRRSLIMWKLRGGRLDGFLNSANPTETVPGDPTTLPAGANINLVDIDYTGSPMPPEGSPQLTWEEKATFARWIDLGTPISHPTAKGQTHGWTLDEQRPALTVSAPRQNKNSALSFLRVGFADAYTGIAPGSLSVKASIAVDGTPANTELAPMGTVVDGVWTLLLKQPLTNITTATLTARVKDNKGNWEQKVVRFSVDGVIVPPQPPTTVTLAFPAPVIATSLVNQTVVMTHPQVTGIAKAVFAVDSRALTTTLVNGQWTASYRPTSAGERTVKVTGYDAAGKQITLVQTKLKVTAAP